MASTTTDKNGNYGFINLNPTSWYSVSVAAPAGDVFTYFQIGSDPLIWSATGMNGQTNYFQVPAGGSMVENAGLVVAGAPGTIAGPGAVPGNSSYTYTVTLNGQVNPTWSIQIASPVNPPPNTVNPVLIMGPNYNAAANTTTESIILSFGNSSPADIFLNASVGGVQVASKEIYLVQVTVAAPDAPTKTFQNGTPQDGGFGELDNGVALKGSASGPAAAPWGLSWAAKVTLNGPGNNLGVNMIHVGFVQHIGIQTWNGKYVNNSTLTASLQGNTYLDMGPDAGGGGYTNQPWYDRAASATFFNATAATNSATINSYDRPNLGPPLTFEQATTVAVQTACNNGTFETLYNRLSDINLLINFTTDVAAQTTDTSNGANLSYWGEAQGAWSFNGTSTVGPRLPNNFPWTANGAVVTPPAGGAWAVLPQTQENTNPPIFNTLLGTVTYR